MGIAMKSCLLVMCVLVHLVYIPVLANLDALRLV